MNCDQAFAALTSGPFPSGQPHRAAYERQVSRHLEACDSCRRIAEALRPAGDIFQESVPPAEGRDLPGYWGPINWGPINWGTSNGGPDDSGADFRGPGYAEATAPAAIGGGQHAGVVRRHAAYGQEASNVTLALPARARAIGSPASHYQRQPGSTLQDLAQVTGFLALVSIAACGLSWFLG
ncbi:MAG: hypothetical protein AAGB00_00085 [Planctomycetota bacterium]